MTAAIRIYEKPKSAAIIFSNVNKPPYPGYEVWIGENGCLRVRLIHNYKGDYIGLRGIQNLADGKWHFVAVTYDGSGKASGFNFYIDGVKEKIQVHTDHLRGDITNSTNGPFVIGNQTDFENDFYFRGEIDEFMLSDIVRDELYLRVYEKTGQVPKPDEHSLLYYNFETLSNGYVKDGSSNIPSKFVDPSLSFKLQSLYKQVVVLMTELSELLQQQR